MDRAALTLYYDRHCAFCRAGLRRRAPTARG